MSIRKKIAIVTGAGRGIGRAIARRLAIEGMVLIIADIDRSQAETVSKEIENSNNQAIPIEVDVSKYDQVKKMIDNVLFRYGYIDILVNNAGIYHRVSLPELTEELWDRMIEINLKGTFLCTKAVVDHMIKQNSGWIVNITSTSGITGGTSGAHYAAAKGGVIAFTRSIARELASYNIYVNAVAPSKIETDMLLLNGNDGILSISKQIPLGRTGKPEEIAEIVYFLTTPASSYIVGEVIVASGGYL
jgi:3-oxoacyl-[acyl-carrier protein] reductase